MSKPPHRHQANGSRPSSINVSTGAARLLAICLDTHNRVPIFGTVEDVFRASELLEGPLASMKKLPPEVEADLATRMDAWAQLPFTEFNITKGQRETVQRGLKALAEKGALQVHPCTMELLKTFGMQP